DRAMEALSKLSTSARAAMEAQSESSSASGTNTGARSMASRSASSAPAHQAAMRSWVAGSSASRSYRASTSSHPPESTSYRPVPHISNAIRSAQASSLSMVDRKSTRLNSSHVSISYA